MGGRGGIAGNPVLIGAATVLVVLVAVFLAYNANQGLPFVPTYSLKAETPSAANLVRGNEVRIGGTRVGSVDKIEVEQQDDGTSIAVLGLKLERSVSPLPKDSTVLIRPRSALGLKYVELTRGTSDEGFEDGDTIPLAQATPTPVEFDEFVNMFDEDTRDAAATNLQGFGDAFAGRGQSLNQAIGALRPLLRDIIPVARNLSSKQTNLPRFIGELADAARIVAPAAESQAQLFVNLDITFGALRAVARPFIQDSISEGPETLDAAIAGFPVQRPFLANTEGLFRELRPGVRALRGAAPDLADALEIGTPVLRRTPAFNRRLASLLTELQTFSEDPLVPRGIRRVTDTVAHAQPDAELPRAGADHLQLHRALVPQHRLAPVRGRPQRHLAAVHHRRDAAGPEQRGQPVVRPGERADAREPPAHQPVPEHRGARPAARVRGGQRAVHQGPDGHLQPARHAADGDGGQALMARTRRRASTQPLRDRADLDRRDRDPRVPRVHEGHPVHARLRGQGGVPVRQRPAARLAGADRRRRGRQGQAGRGPGGQQQRRRDDGRSTTAGGPCTRTRRSRSARASSSRATSSSTSSRARRALRSSTTAARSR